MATILIVDDSKLARTLSRRALHRGGHDTLEAESGHEGLKMAMVHKPDCIVLDLLMPEMKGIQFLSSMHEQGMEIPVVVVTADIQKDVRAECLAKGAIDVINKPDSRGDELLNSIANAVRSPDQKS